MKTINVSLPDPLEAFVQRKVTSGGYSSASEVIREGLRLLQEYDAQKLRMLRAALREGFESEQGPLLGEISAAKIASRGKERLKRKSR